MHKAEKKFGYSKGYLWGLAGDELRVEAKWPDEIPQDSWLRRRITEKAGNLRGLPSRERSAKRLQAYREIKTEDENRIELPDYGFGENIERWDPLFASDWKRFLGFNMAFEDRSADEMRLFYMIPKEIAQLHATRDPITGKKILPSGSPMVEGTTQKYTLAISRIFGSCVNLARPMAKDKNKETANKSDLKQYPGRVKDKETAKPLLPKEDFAEMGLALAAIPEVIEHYYDTQVFRKVLAKKPAKLSKTNVKEISLMKRILLYIEQQPHFAQRLKPVPGLITADQVREAKADWAVFCAKALRRYEQIYQGRKGWTADKIDHALPVVGILRSKRPQEALNCIFEVLVGHLAALPKRNKRRANKIKDVVMAGLKVQGYFRPNTEKRLNFKHDNTDNIYWSMEAGKKVWCVRAPMVF